MYMYYIAIESLYLDVVCYVPLSCITNRDRNQLVAWLDSEIPCVFVDDYCTSRVNVTPVCCPLLLNGYFN